MGKFVDKTGQRFGRLVVLERAEDGFKKDGRKIVRWLCKCDCGNEITVKTDNLGVRTNSCGCLRKERNPKRTHGKSNTRLYHIWSGIKERCLNPNQRCYYRYGGRGITIYDEWRNSFEAFYEWAMNNGYSDELTIDRIDNNGNYEPNNCQWVTNEKQARNRRSNRKYTYNGKTMCLTDWANELGIDFGLLRNRLNTGWDFEKAVETPKKWTQIEYKGETHTYKEWGVITGIKPRTIEARINKGWCVKDALTIPTKTQAGIYIPNEFITDVAVALDAEGELV